MSVTHQVVQQIPLSVGPPYDRSRQRMERIRMLELEQIKWDQEALVMSDAMNQALLLSFKDVKTEFCDLDGMSWERYPDRRICACPAHHGYRAKPGGVRRCSGPGSWCAKKPASRPPLVALRPPPSPPPKPPVSKAHVSSRPHVSVAVAPEQPSGPQTRSRAASVSRSRARSVSVSSRASIETIRPARPSSKFYIEEEDEGEEDAYGRDGEMTPVASPRVR